MPTIMKTTLGWATMAWNVITGCSEVSEGCKNCYAKRTALRQRGNFGYPIDQPFAVTYHKNLLTTPYLLNNSTQRIAVANMGDLFHDEVLSVWQDAIFDVMINNPRHIFLLLTKRPKNMVEYFTRKFGDGSLPMYRLRHIWWGVSVENQPRADERVSELLKLPSGLLRFVVAEPLLGPVSLKPWMKDIGWVIASCERSFRTTRTAADPNWFRTLRDDCKREPGRKRIPFYLAAMSQPLDKPKNYGRWKPVTDALVQFPKLDKKQYIEVPEYESEFMITHKVTMTYKQKVSASSLAEAKKRPLDYSSASVDTVGTTVTGDAEGFNRNKWELWSPEETRELVRMVHGIGRWGKDKSLSEPWTKIAKDLSSRFGKRRTPKACERRWEKIKNGIVDVDGEE